jgi:nicotinamidase-related amidase
MVAALRFTASSILALSFSLMGCGDAMPSGDAGGDGGDVGQGGSPSAGPGGEGASTPSTNSLAMAVIDIQESFVTYAANLDKAAVIDRAAGSFQLAQEHGLPFLLTFEASKAGDHALHAPLQPWVPSHGEDFIKTRFAATGLPAFHDAVLETAASHVVVLGTETDVCVLQTVLGLRTMGLSVMLQTDAVLSSETNVPPALRRMQQAGVALIDHSELEAFVDDPSLMPAAPPGKPTIVSPLAMGVVLNDFTDATVAASGDPLMTQKSARLKELLLISEWFERPVYVNDVSAGLPGAYASSYQGELRPIGQLADDPEIGQLVFAGADTDVAARIQAWASSHDLFVMEDALLTTGSLLAQAEALAPLFAQGVVPTTYKTFYYEMTVSVDLSEWPAASWVDKYDEYYWITQAPEALPPIHP